MTRQWWIRVFVAVSLQPVLIVSGVSLGLVVHRHGTRGLHLHAVAVDMGDTGLSTRYEHIDAPESDERIEPLDDLFIVVIFGGPALVSTDRPENREIAQSQFALTSHFAVGSRIVPGLLTANGSPEANRTVAPASHKGGTLALLTGSHALLI